MHKYTHIIDSCKNLDFGKGLSKQGSLWWVWTLTYGEILAASLKVSDKSKLGQIHINVQNLQTTCKCTDWTRSDHMQNYTYWTRPPTWRTVHWLDNMRPQSELYTDWTAWDHMQICTLTGHHETTCRTVHWLDNILCFVAKSFNDDLCIHVGLMHVHAYVILSVCVCVSLCFVWVSMFINVLLCHWFFSLYEYLCVPHLSCKVLWVTENAPQIPCYYHYCHRTHRLY